MNRRFRLLAALGIAILLSTFMIYSALAGNAVSEPVIEAHELDDRATTAERNTVELVGVAAGPVTGERGERMRFFISDRRGKHRVAVTYSGSVPDAFRVGRHVIVKGRLKPAGAGGGTRTFRARPNSLVTKCPSKFESESGSGRSST